MRIQYILHADFELPGIIQVWAKEHSCHESFARPYAKEKMPSSKDFDLLVLMGGPQSPLNMEEAPYLKDEIALVKETIKSGLPILGFCLGAQILGEALGAPAERSPFKEVGVFPIELTQEGCQDPLLAGLPKRFAVSHWHNDMPGLTADAKILATSQGCPRQIVRYASNLYGFQCHPEMMKSNIESMIHHCPEDLSPAPFVQSKSDLLAQDFAAINSHMMTILNNLLLLSAFV